MGKISLILPIYNEAAILQEVLAKYITDLKKLGCAYEIIAVNDGCTDGSTEILLGVAKLNRSLRIVNLDGRWGKQAAITAGMEAADKSSDAVILADVDLLNPVGILKRIVDEFKLGNPIVYARRENLGFGNAKTTLSDGAVKVAARVFGVQGFYTGKAHIAMYSRAVADVITSLPDRNKFLRAMDNWVGWNVKYISYASGYNKTEEHQKVKEAVVRHKKMSKADARRDKIREHTPSMDMSLAFVASAIIFSILGLMLAFGIAVEPKLWMHLVAWLGCIMCLFIAGLFYLRAILVKRVGVLHASKSAKLFVIKNVIN